jgi:hypothetical protein
MPDRVDAKNVAVQFGELLMQIHNQIRIRHYSIRTEEAYWRLGGERRAFNVQNSIPLKNIRPRGGRLQKTGKIHK